MPQMWQNHESLYDLFEMLEFIEQIHFTIQKYHFIRVTTSLFRLERTRM